MGVSVCRLLKLTTSYNGSVTVRPLLGPVLIPCVAVVGFCYMLIDISLTNVLLLLLLLLLLLPGDTLFCVGSAPL